MVSELARHEEAEMDVYERDRLLVPDLVWAGLQAKWRAGILTRGDLALAKALVR